VHHKWIEKSMADEPKSGVTDTKIPDDAEVAGTSTAPRPAAATAAPRPAPPAGAGVGGAPPRPAPPAGTAPVAGAHARPAVPPRPAAPAGPPPDLAGKVTSPVVGTPAKKPAAAAAAADEDDTSPLMSRRAWIGVAWGAFTAASVAALAATGRFMFPNVINEPPAQFKVGFPAEYGMGVDERFKETMGVWIVRTPQDVVHNVSGFFVLLTTCTHLGCTPNYLSAEAKFKCPCHGSGFRAATGINFEGPAPRPLERARVVLADDGQILVDKSRKFQYELGQWADPEAFLPA
jgi:cytochrome b6-f complex iron-sulfur subunit